jgi:hypothetical protein
MSLHFFCVPLAPLPWPNPEPHLLSGPEDSLLVFIPFYSILPPNNAQSTFLKHKSYYPLTSSEWKKIFAKHMSDKRHMPRIYKELSKLDIRK